MKLPRHAEIWLQPYLADRVRRRLSSLQEIRHIWWMIADHFEPFVGGVDRVVAHRRVDAWRKNWPEIAARVADKNGKALPRYTFFYPVEQYHAGLVESLAEMTRDGIGDVEVHLHHDRDTRENFIRCVTDFCGRLVEDHGLLRKVGGKIRFGFIHGNWALDNSLADGRWCGLNDEITLLRDLGCYADFTMPSGASPTQARTINTLYWCRDDPHRQKSYDRGIPVEPGTPGNGDLLMIPGPLGLRWNEGLLPRMETGELAFYDPPSAYRTRRWFDLAPRLGEHVFLKLYTHGAHDRNLDALLRNDLYVLFDAVRAEAERHGARLHFVSAWQMYLAIEAISQGKSPLDALPVATADSVGARQF